MLDEPFSGLDPGGVDVLAGVLSERAEDGVAVVFSSHQLELVERLCRSVAIVNDGRLVASGPVEAAARHASRMLRGGGRRWLRGLVARGARCRRRRRSRGRRRAAGAAGGSR
ncbi:MAG: hypothetical protein WKF40_02825 [Thermoleophilaceae bacterium]